MAYPTLTAATATQFSTAVTSMAVNLPSASAGELIIAFVEVRNTAVWTIPSGWSSLIEQVGGGSVGQLSVFYKIATGSEGSTATWSAATGTTAVWHTRKVSGWQGVTIPEVMFATGDSASVDPPSLIPTWGSAETLWITVAGHAAGSNAAYTAAPSGYSDFTATGTSSGGSAVSLASAARTNTASSEDPSAFTAANNRWWTAMTIAVRPITTTIVERLTVNGAGTYSPAGWDAEGGDYTRLQSNDGDTSRLYTPTSGSTRTVTHTALSVSGSPTISSVTVNLKIRNLDPLSSNNRPILKIGSTVYEQGNRTNNGQSYQTISSTWTTDPSTGSAWTVSGVNNAEIGLQKQDGNGTGWTYAEMMVEYSIPPTPSFTQVHSTDALKHSEGAASVAIAQYVTATSTTNYVQGIVATLPGSVVAGNTLILSIATTAGTANDISSVTDTQGNTWAKATSYAANGRNVDVWYASNVAAGSTAVTATSTAYTQKAITLLEVAGLYSPVTVGTVTQQADSGYVNTRSISVASGSDKFVLAAFAGTDGAAVYTGTVGTTLSYSNSGDTTNLGVVVDLDGANSITLNSTAYEQGAFVSVPFQITSGTPVPVPPGAVDTPNWYPYGVLPAGKSVTALQTIVKNWWTNHFKPYIVTTGTPEAGMYRVKRPENADDTVSEGIGYALIGAVWMAEYDPAAKTIFDGLLKYAKYYYNPNGMMKWHISAAGVPLDEGSATDADYDIAWGLHLAAQKWGSSANYNYTTERDSYMSAMLSKDHYSATHATVPLRNVMINGDGWDPSQTGTPNKYDPDYTAPMYYKAWASLNSRWDDIRTANWNIIENVDKYNTGLFPDRMTREGTPADGENFVSGYNSVRRFRQVADYLNYGSTRETPYIDYYSNKRLADFSALKSSNVPANLRAEWAIDGTSSATYLNSLFASAYMVTMLVDPANSQLAADTIDWIVANPDGAYFGDTVAFMNLGTAAGYMTPTISASPITTVEKTHTTSSAKRTANAKTHSTNAIKRKASSISHTTSSSRSPQPATLSTDYVGFTFAPPLLAQTITHSTSAVKRKASTLAHSTDAFKRTVTAVAHTTSANKKKTTLATHTTSAVIRKQATVSHTTSFAKRKASVLQHTTNALKRATGQVSHNTSSIKRIISTKSHTTNAFLRSGQSIAHTTNALKRKLFTLAHSTNAFKRAQNIVTHTTNANKRRQTLIAHTTNAFLRGASSVTHTTSANRRRVGNIVAHLTSAVTRKSNTVAHQTSANKKKAANLRSHTTNVLLRRVSLIVHSTSANKRRANNLASHLTSSVVRRSNTAAHTTSANKKRANNLRAHTTNAIKRKMFELLHTADANKRTGNNLLSHTTGSLLRKVFTKSHTTSLVKRKGNQTQHSTGSVIRGRYFSIHRTDILKRERNYLTHGTDANTRKVTEISHSTDTVLRERDTRSHTTSANKRKLTAILHTTDANKKKSNNLRSHTTDANKRKLTTRSHTTNSLKRGRYIRSHTTSINKKKLFVLAHTADANRRKGTTQYHTTSSFIRKGNERYHLTDIVKRGQDIVLHLADANKRKATIVVHTTDANKKTSYEVSHTTSASLYENRGQKKVKIDGVWYSSPAHILIDGIWVIVPVLVYDGRNWHYLPE